MPVITLKVKGRCMSPLMKEGDTVRIESRKKFNTGDIIVYFNENHELIVHRYARIFGRERTKAERNIYFDSWVIKKPLGKVLLEEPLFKRIKMVFRLKAQLLNELLRGTF